MILLLSPAKTMDMSPAQPGIEATEPLFAAEAEDLALRMKRYSADELARILKLAPQLARQTYEQYVHFDDRATPVKQAVLAYNGAVYRSLDAPAFDAPTRAYAQVHLRIVSTLYGLLRPYDRIKQYRLNFHLRLSGMQGQSLYEFWRPRLTPLLVEEARKAGGVVINLSSREVMGAFDRNELAASVRVIDVDFKDKRPAGDYQSVRAYSKPAGGELAREAMLGRIATPEALRDFRWNRYAFNEKLSTEEHYVFTR
ncbi:MAG: YaaA family protein [Rikenellaceae bacterium]|nr:YaaA family protein [Rikenellaceae bacterium]